MTDEVTYSGRWVSGDYAGLPAASQHDLMRADRQAKHEAEEAQARRDDYYQNLSMMAERQGRDVSLAGAFNRALMGSRRSDYIAQKAELRAKVQSGEVEVLDGSMSRSDPADTGYGEDRAVRQAQENRQWMAAYLVRHRGQAAVEAARRKSGYGRRQASRSRFTVPGAREITRVTSSDGMGQMDTMSRGPVW